MQEMVWAIGRVLLVGLLMNAGASRSELLYHGDFEDKLGFFLSVGHEKNLSRYTVILEGRLLSDRTWIDGVQVSTVNEFETALSKIPQGSNVVFYLNSRGGLAGLVDEIREVFTRSGFHLTTYLSSHTRCESACLGLFMLGRDRFAEVGSSFGFHRTRRRRPNGSSYLESSRQAKAHVVKWGLDEDWAEGLRRQRVFSDIKITPFEAQAPALNGSGLITEIVDPF